MRTATDVAHWMLLELERRGGWLPEAEAVSFIAQTFGGEFVSEHARGPSSVNRVVVDALLQLSGGTVRWNEGERAWLFSDAGEAGERLV